MPALDLMEVNIVGGPLDALTTDRQARIGHRELDLIAGEARQFGGDNVAVCGLVDIDWRRPRISVVQREALEPFLPGPQIAPRIHRHSFDGIRFVGFGVIMSSLQATRMKKGMLIKIGDDLFRVLDLQHVTPGNLRGFVRVRFRNIRTGTLSDQKLRSEDTVERAILDERQMQYLYKDGDSYHFMDTESYEQMHMSAEALGESVNFLIPEATIAVEFYGSEPVGIELPVTVDLTVEDTAPGIKGATASAQVKPARLETGLVVQVPPFVNTGDKVRVSTDTGEYLSRA